MFESQYSLNGRDGRMEWGEFGELGRGQISDVSLPMRDFKLYPESKTGEGIEGSILRACIGINLSISTHIHGGSDGLVSNTSVLSKHPAHCTQPSSPA